MEWPQLFQGEWQQGKGGRIEESVRDHGRPDGPMGNDDETQKESEQSGQDRAHHAQLQVARSEENSNQGHRGGLSG